MKAQGILSAKNGMSLYRGCSHGCIYCDSRSKCYHREHAFEDIEVKEHAIDLLEYALTLSEMHHHREAGEKGTDRKISCRTGAAGRPGHGV